MPSHLRSPITDLPAPPFELTGPPNAPLLVVLGGISATRHVTSTATDARDGWWQSLVFPGGPVDTRRYRVLGIDWATAVDTPVTTFDQARAIVTVLDRLGVDRAAAIVGASYGGMVALAFGAAHPNRVERLVVISGAHESHPMATAHRVIQRRIIRLGLAAGTPSDGVALARALGVTTYRTAVEFAARFDVAPEDLPHGYQFPIERYLDHGARRFAAVWSAERYLALSESLDLHRVDPATIAVPTALLGVLEDTLVPAWQLRDLAQRIGGGGSLTEISSIYGHDAFLKEVAAVGAFVARAIAEEVRCAA